MGITTGFWVIFGLVIVGMLVLDLGVINRKAHVVGVREAFGWTMIWITLALVFGAGVFSFLGPQKGTEFLTAYLIEESLSIDNLFVFLVIFSYFHIPQRYQQRGLFWGIIGAIFMRGMLIAGGIALLERMHWLIYVFGVFLLFTAARLAMDRGHKVKPDNNVVAKLFSRMMPVHPEHESGKFFLKIAGKRHATVLFLALVVIAFSDFMFAMDSIPAVLAISRDPFIVYTSNIFAVLGLRSLYFLLAGALNYLTYLKPGLAVVLFFVGMKMLLADVYHISPLASLGAVATILGVAAGASVIRQKCMAKRRLEKVVTH